MDTGTDFKMKCQKRKEEFPENYIKSLPEEKKSKMRWAAKIVRGYFFKEDNNDSKTTSN